MDIIVSIINGKLGNKNWEIMLKNRHTERYTKRKVLIEEINTIRPPIRPRLSKRKDKKKDKRERLIARVVAVWMILKAKWLNEVDDQ